MDIPLAKTVLKDIIFIIWYSVQEERWQKNSLKKNKMMYRVGTVWSDLGTLLQGRIMFYIPERLSEDYKRKDDETEVKHEQNRMSLKGLKK